MHTTDHEAAPGTRVDACVILEGGLRLSPLAKETGVSALDLWLGGAHRSVFDHWLARLAPCAAPGAAVFVVHDANSRPPRVAIESNGLNVHVVRESRDYRGPAGVALDVCRDMAPSSRLLIADAARILVGDLADVLRTHDLHAEAMTVVANPDASPAGIYVTAREHLGLVPERGFMDLKEQWLARMSAAQRPIWVHRLKAPGALPLRTRQQALDAARALHTGAEACAPRALWRVPDATPPDMFAAVAPGATVDPGAMLADTVVMDGATIGERAVVVRSLVLPGARIEAGAQVVDKVVVSGAVVSAG
jgi:hypothetical protein